MRIAIYPGSFDPIHKGHIEIIQSVLNDVDQIYVVHNLPNKGKLLRSSDLHRSTMNKLALANIAKVTCTDTDAHELVKQLRQDKNNELIGIIGLDSWLNITNKNKEPHLKADSFWIVPRVLKNMEPNNNINQVSQVYKGHSVKLLDYNYKYQDYSSSEARSALFKQKLDSKLMEYVDQKVLDYIKEYDLYSFSYYGKLILSKELNSNNFSYQELSSYTGYGSKNIIMSDRLVLKFCNNSTELCDFSETHTLLNSFGTQVPRSKVIEAVPAFVIIMDRVNGLSVYDTIKQEFLNNKKTNKQFDNDKIANFGYLLGRALKDLHGQKPTGIIDDNFLITSRKIKKMEVYMPNILKELSQYKLSDLVGCVHGDANLGNFMLQEAETDPKIIMIDYNKSYDLPGYEYWQLIGGIEVQLKEFSIHEVFINGFINGYGDIPKHFELFKDYWLKCCVTNPNQWATTFQTK